MVLSFSRLELAESIASSGILTLSPNGTPVRDHGGATKFPAWFLYLLDTPRGWINAALSLALRILLVPLFSRIGRGSAMGPPLQGLLGYVFWWLLGAPQVTVIQRMLCGPNWALTRTAQIQHSNATKKSEFRELYGHFRSATRNLARALSPHRRSCWSNVHDPTPVRYRPACCLREGAP